MELLKSPFLNDPSAIVAQAFEIEYPGKVFEAILVEKIEIGRASCRERVCTDV